VKRFLSSLVLAAALVRASGTLAADMPAPFYKAPPPLTAWSWTGFYVGGNVGYGISHDPTADSLSVTAPGGSAVFSAETFSHSGSGASGGGQLGYNWQFAPHWVVGLEVDGQASGQQDRACVFGCIVPMILQVSGADEQKLDWFGTARARIGFAQEGWLLYATGGAAWGRVDDTLSVSLGNGPMGNVTTASFSHDKVGWAAGAGIETHLWGGWTAKLEYLHVDLGGYSNTLGAMNTPVFGAGVFTMSSSSGFQDNIVRAGLNYKFY
jgi:outer membrane immunogenic protein